MTKRYERGLSVLISALLLLSGVAGSVGGVAVPSDEGDGETTDSGEETTDDGTDAGGTASGGTTVDAPSVCEDPANMTQTNLVIANALARYGGRDGLAMTKCAYTTSYQDKPPHWFVMTGIENETDLRVMVYPVADLGNADGWIEENLPSEFHEGSPTSLDYWEPRWETYSRLKASLTLMRMEWVGTTDHKWSRFVVPTPEGKLYFVRADADGPRSQVDARIAGYYVYYYLLEASIDAGAVGGSAAPATATATPTATAVATATRTAESGPVATESTPTDETPATGDTTVTATETTGVETTTAPPGEQSAAAVRTALDELHDAGVVESGAPVTVGEVDAAFVEDVQEVVADFLLAEDDLDELVRSGELFTGLSGGFSSDGDALDALDVTDGQDVTANRGQVFEAFEDDIAIDDDGALVARSDGIGYEGENATIGKVTSTIAKESFDEADKQYLKKLKTGHDAMKYFSPEYSDAAGDTGVFEATDTVKQAVDTYEETRTIKSQLKGSAGTATAVLYLVGEGAKTVGEKVPVVGDAIAKYGEMAAETAKVLPDLDKKVKESGFRQGRVTNGPSGTSSVNAFYASYERTEHVVTRTYDDGSKGYAIRYTDENGEENEVSPYLWKTTVQNGKTYTVPYDADLEPIGDVALQDVDAGWKLWKSDNVKLVKRSNPAVEYNGGEEYDL
ncbi:hypothetical protein QA599_20505 [Haloarculaceae archaeon H-GB1-1]|nr:hypothetical protein [Haloarculaceae archaeon H-GB1-1]